MTKCDDIQEGKDKWSRNKYSAYQQALYHHHHTTTFPKFRQIYPRRVSYMKYGKLTSTYFQNFQKILIWCLIIVFWRQSPSLLLFSAHKCHHDQVSTVMPLNCHDGQVNKLCCQWTCPALNQQHQDHNNGDLPCDLYRSGLYVFYTLFCIAIAIPWSDLGIVDNQIRHNGSTQCR